MLLLGVVSLAAASQVPQPVVRLGNFTEVANDVFMHIIGVADIRYKTIGNYNCENRVRDRVNNCSPSARSTHEADSDVTEAL
jgi:hypothetical protein